MKLATLETPYGPAPAAWSERSQAFVLLSNLEGPSRGRSKGGFGSMLELIRAGERGLDHARELLHHGERAPSEKALIPAARAKLLAPIPTPPRLRCFSVYERHMRQSLDQVLRHRIGAVAGQLIQRIGVVGPSRRWREVPAYYKGNHLSVAGPEHRVECPSYARWLDYELELAVVLGKGGTDIARGDAMSHIFGYTIFNDFSARDILIDEMGDRPSTGPAKGKDFNGGNVLGPWIVTADEVVDPHALKMSVKVNGDLRGQARSGDMHHRIDALIAYASCAETLVEGEVFGCGAVGDGTGIESWRFLADGDVVELEIEGIGVLRNAVSVPQERST